MHARPEIFGQTSKTKQRKLNLFNLQNVCSLNLEDLNQNLWHNYFVDYFYKSVRRPALQGALTMAQTVSEFEIALLVLQYLESNGWIRTSQSFKK